MNLLVLPSSILSATYAAPAIHYKCSCTSHAQCFQKLLTLLKPKYQVLAKKPTSRITVYLLRVRRLGRTPRPLSRETLCCGCLSRCNLTSSSNTPLGDPSFQRRRFLGTQIEEAMGVCPLWPDQCLLRTQGGASAAWPCRRTFSASPMQPPRSRQSTWFAFR